MGLLDWIKARVGIGSARIALDAPHVVCAGSPLRLRVTIAGGTFDQTLHGIDVARESERRAVAGLHISTVHRRLIGRGRTLVWDATLDVPAFDRIYPGDPRAQALCRPADSAHDPFGFNRDTDEPLPALGELGSRSFCLRASADLAGVAAPLARHPISVLPEARGGESVAVGRIDSRALMAHLQSLGVVRS